MSTTTTHTATVVPLAQIHVVDGANPRRRFDETALRELADSIAKHGMIQPLVVHPNSEGYVLIAGERRYRAAGLAGLDSVPVTIRDESESRLELAVDENLHRQALDPIEPRIFGLAASLVGASDGGGCWSLACETAVSAWGGWA